MLGCCYSYYNVVLGFYQDSFHHKGLSLTFKSYFIKVRMIDARSAAVIEIL